MQDLVREQHCNCKSPKRPEHRYPEQMIHRTLSPRRRGHQQNTTSAAIRHLLDEDVDPEILLQGIATYERAVGRAFLANRLSLTNEPMLNLQMPCRRGVQHTDAQYNGLDRALSTDASSYPSFSNGERQRRQHVCSNKHDIQNTNNHSPCTEPSSRTGSFEDHCEPEKADPSFGSQLTHNNTSDIRNSWSNRRLSGDSGSDLYNITECVSRPVLQRSPSQQLVRDNVPNQQLNHGRTIDGWSQSHSRTNSQYFEAGYHGFRDVQTSSTKPAQECDHISELYQVDHRDMYPATLVTTTGSSVAPLAVEASLNNNSTGSPELRLNPQVNNMYHNDASTIQELRWTHAEPQNSLSANMESTSLDQQQTSTYTNLNGLLDTYSAWDKDQTDESEDLLPPVASSDNEATPIVEETPLSRKNNRTKPVMSPRTTNPARDLAVNRHRHWSLEDDNLLKDAVLTYQKSSRKSAIQWSIIASKLDRTGVQCQARWSEVLDTSILKGRWSSAEDTALVKAHARHGSAWNKIADVIKVRTQRQCRSRWMQLQLRKTSREVE